MRIIPLSIVILMQVLNPIEAGSRSADAMWDSRCEECHGDSKRFAGKYLWDIDGKLQGQHHIDNLDLFLNNHYLPDHEIDAIANMLLARANSTKRFKTECGDCHGDARGFVEKSVWVRGSNITGKESGKDISETLPAHMDLRSEDITFYRKLFARVAGKPIP